jgi:Mrp family chromosome partitioning ATPase
MQTLQLIQSVQAQDPALAALLSARAETLDRRAQLALRRDQVSVDAALATSGVVLTSSAVEAERSMGLGRLAVLGLLAGLIVGVAVAYNRSLRSRRFEHRYEPELIVEAPLLAEVPDFNREKLSTLIPVRDAPLSASAESFRFAAAAMLGRVDLSGQVSENGGEPSSNGHRLLALTSAWEGDGKTVAVANLGAAVASRGRRVLLVDADFGDQALTKVVSDFLGWHPGLTDVVELGVDLSLAVRAISTGGGLKFDLLARGTQSVSAPEFFRSSETAAFFEKVRELYDLVLVDLPPVLQVAYAGSVLNLCDDVVLVVPHRGDVSVVSEAVDRVGLTGTSIVGYIYNKAPLREEMVAKGSSMRDPWGVSEEASVS